MQEHVEAHEHAPIRCVVLDLSAVSLIDTSGADAMRDWQLEYSRNGVQLVLAAPGSTMTQLGRLNLLITIGKARQSKSSWYVSAAW